MKTSRHPTRVETRIHAIKAPCSGETREHRFQAALPNDAGLKGSTSYGKQYLVYEGIVTRGFDGTYSAADIERHMARLAEQGFTQ